MNLPLVVDIALGLLFLYLTLSLLASEIQELITTLLQWRAQHLKKSIEVLFSGDNTDDLPGIAFTDQLYQSPLIRSLNQEAKGPFSKLFRELAHRIGQSYRIITRTRNVFGILRSGPSYIPAESFAAALVENLSIQHVAFEKSRDTLVSFADEKLDLINNLLESLRNSTGDYSLLEDEFGYLKQQLDEIAQDFSERRMPFAAAMDLSIEQLTHFLESTELVLGTDGPCQDIIRARLPYLKKSVSTRKLEPTISEVVQGVIAEKDYIPEQLKRNLVSLAQDAQVKSGALTEGVRDLEKRIESWFDRSMERASGVYKRNARGVALIIGFVIAFASNTDTFYVVNRLSKDTLLRSSISQAADQLTVSRTIAADETAEFGDIPADAAEGAVGIVNEDGAIAELQEIRDAVNAALEGIPLPIGWNQVIVQEQLVQANGWQFPILRRVLGWLVTGIALSMGASFWYNLLGKIIQIKNTGSAPDSKS